MRFEIDEGCVCGTAVAVCSEFACVRWVLGTWEGVAGSSFKGALPYKLSASILWTASFLLSRVLLGGVSKEGRKATLSRRLTYLLGGG